MNDAPLANLTFDRFAALVNSWFRVHLSPADTVELQLIEVSRGQAPAPAAGQPRSESFALLFRGPPDRLLDQRIYRFEQDQAGHVELFIVPIGRAAAGMLYQAIFNRLIPDRA